VKVFRHADPRFPFLWEGTAQPPARWHGPGEGPVHYFADTPAGAWVEFLRHEEIREVEDLKGVRRALWLVEVASPPRSRPSLPEATLTGGLDTYAECQAEAARLRSRGAKGLLAPSAALRERERRGWKVDGGLQEGPERDGQVLVLFGHRPDLLGWRIVDQGHPPLEAMAQVRHFDAF
jgi:hypothetical protein